MIRITTIHLPAYREWLAKEPTRESERVRFNEQRRTIEGIIARSQVEYAMYILGVEIVREPDIY